MDRLGEKCKKDLSKLFTKIVKANPVNFWYLTFGYEQHNGEENPAEFKFILHIWSLLVSKSLELSFIKMG